MDEKQIKALIKSIEQIMGNPIEADAREIDALFAEFGNGKAPAQSVFDLASQAAQKYRLEGKTVPIHVTEALNAARRAVSGEGVCVLSDARHDSIVIEFMRGLSMLGLARKYHMKVAEIEEVIRRYTRKQ